MAAAQDNSSRSRSALVTGASRGLGLALTRRLLALGWDVTVDARDRARLEESLSDAPGPGRLTVVPGDVADAEHRHALAAAARSRGQLHLLVNNASVLGPSPQPGLAEYPLETLRSVYEVNVFAPLSLSQLLLPALARVGGTIVNVSSDAAVEAYPGWGGYGSAKAALDHLSAVLAVEHPDVRVLALDPGDMATDLQQQAFPGEDVSDRADPESVVPVLLQLVEDRRPSGRYRVADLAAGTTSRAVPV
ncbi:MAG TPA: SDR family oxidoreductase [Actinomycetales bacterium]|nr:SDR family oxidoreductase [Actinomycetales bacterium]